MTLNKSLRDEIKKIQKHGRELKRKRVALTREIDQEIKENEAKEQLIRDFMVKMSPSVGSDGVKRGRGRPKKVITAGTGGRKSRASLLPEMRRIIQNSPNGIRRKEIIRALGLVGDKRSHQSITNFISRLKEAGDIRAVGRQYFPPAGTTTTSTETTSAENDTDTQQESSGDEAAGGSSTDTTEGRPATPYGSRPWASRQENDE